ncbi:hypothetical protein AMAG_11738 [Allomyces macrogynus ATCC 38327]|uniref:Uncharacterized protein n=1 Tax=Allomyces macrogynus (strain ATCC 38327) TaxID=578462 RepID=A0A0L0SW60_ALLM3|nr:hypothetical protein AMAG_11738 [Allomyces macrogynus ATCC 38327]|eukprot:KNE66620.1 hypothetical protein AMAG_11738 [Allomyces macrogynus ATCC 38327]
MRCDRGPSGAVPTKALAPTSCHARLSSCPCSSPMRAVALTPLERLPSEILSLVVAVAHARDAPSVVALARASPHVFGVCIDACVRLATTFATIDAIESGGGSSSGAALVAVLSHPVRLRQGLCTMPVSMDQLAPAILVPQRCLKRTDPWTRAYLLLASPPASALRRRDCAAVPLRLLFPIPLHRLGPQLVLLGATPPLIPRLPSALHILFVRMLKAGNKTHRLAWYRFLQSAHALMLRKLHIEVYNVTNVDAQLADFLQRPELRIEQLSLSFLGPGRNLIKDEILAALPRATLTWLRLLGLSQPHALDAITSAPFPKLTLLNCDRVLAASPAALVLAAPKLSTLELILDYVKHTRVPSVLAALPLAPLVETLHVSYPSAVKPPLVTTDLVRNSAGADRVLATRPWRCTDEPDPAWVDLEFVLAPLELPLPAPPQLLRSPSMGPGASAGE